MDIKAKKILAFLEVTDDDDEKVQTMKESMSKLIGHILKRNNNNIKFKSVLCDVLTIVRRISNIFKIKGLDLLQSRSERTLV